MLNNNQHLTNYRQDQNSNLYQIFKTVENCGRVAFILSSLSFVGSVVYSVAKDNLKQQDSSSLNNFSIDNSTSANQTLANLSSKNSLKSNLYGGIIFSIAVFGVGVILAFLGKFLQNHIDFDDANEFALRNSLIRFRQLNFSNFSSLQNRINDLENYDNEPLEQEHNPPEIQNNFAENPMLLENDLMPSTYSNPVIPVSANQLSDNQNQLVT